jgi:hypothetical protein
LSGVQIGCSLDMVTWRKKKQKEKIRHATPIGKQELATNISIVMVHERYKINVKNKIFDRVKTYHDRCNVYGVDDGSSVQLRVCVS